MNAENPTKRPNVLVIIADQLRSDHLGFAGNETVRTPHLDALASQSVVFTEATVTNPTCMPNRASLLTGRWPSAHGTRCNGIPLDPDANTMVRSMARSGYRTFAVGKLHHQNMGWPLEPEQQAEIAATDPLLLSGSHQDAITRDREPGWDRWENRDDHDASFIEMPKDYYGYEHVDLVIGHGDSPGGHYVHWAAERGADPRVLGGTEQAVRRFEGWDQVYETAVPASAHPSTYIGETAVQRLHELADVDDPFFLFVSFPDPHHPFSPPGGYADLYDPAAIPLPNGFNQDHAKSPAHVREMMAHRGRPGSDPTMTWAVSEDQYRHAAAAQYGLITLMDEQIGRILQALADRRLEEDTIVLFTSDHGDMFGDHGLMLKHFSHYRALTNVPLTLRIPHRPARRTDVLVSTADIAPTLLALTGTEPYRGIQGTSLVPVLDEESAQVHAALLVEEDQPFGLPGLPGPVRIRSLVTETGRLTRYFGTDEVELYDRVRDPGELNNVAADPAYREMEQDYQLLMLEEIVALSVMGTAPTAAA